MPALAQRDRQPELMDQPGLDKQEHAYALRGLRRVNWISGSAAIFWPTIRRLAETEDRTIRVLDIATGGGDVALEIYRRAKKSKLPIEVAGCDISETSIALSIERAEQFGADIRYFQADALGDSLPDEFDVVMNSLFMHHLDEDDAETLLRRMAAATRKLVLVNDLIRSPAGYLLAYFGTRLLTRSYIVHTDGPLSVKAAFTTDEILALASDAGLKNVKLTRHWPYRFLLQWERDF